MRLKVTFQALLLLMFQSVKIFNDEADDNIVELVQDLLDNEMKGILEEDEIATGVIFDHFKNAQKTKDNINQKQI